MSRFDIFNVLDQEAKEAKQKEVEAAAKQKKLLQQAFRVFSKHHPLYGLTLQEDTVENNYDICLAEDTIQEDWDRLSVDNQLKWATHERAFDPLSTTQDKLRTFYRLQYPEVFSRT